MKAFFFFCPWTTHWLTIFIWVIWVIKGQSRNWLLLWHISEGRIQPVFILIFFNIFLNFCLPDIHYLPDIYVAHCTSFRMSGWLNHKKGNVKVVVAFFLSSRYNTIFARNPCGLMYKWTLAWLVKDYYFEVPNSLTTSLT